MPRDRRSPDRERRSGSPRSESGTDRHRRRRREDSPPQQASQLRAPTTQLPSIGALISLPPSYQSLYQPPGYPSNPAQGHPFNPSPGHQPYQPQAQQQGYASGPFGTNVERERQGTKEQAIPVSASANLGPEQAATSSARQNEKRLRPESKHDKEWTEQEVEDLMAYRRRRPTVNWTTVTEALGNGHDAGDYQRKWDRMRRAEKYQEDKAKKEREADDLEKASGTRQQKP